MSNETDLDWLALNVHVWKSGYDLAVVQRGGGEIYVTWPSVCSSGITKKQWLTRRAELQNKPSWADAPEWATNLVQIGSGAWVWCDNDRLEMKFGGGDRFEHSGNYGAILGDWRDTLERRPEAMTTTVSQEDIGHLGMKSDHGKPILGAIPPHAELAVGRVLAFGAEKYARGNWDHVADHENRYMDAALRHLNAHRRGELVDGESGESHLAHAACCILFLLDKQERAGGAA